LHCAACTFFPRERHDAFPALPLFFFLENAPFWTHRLYRPISSWAPEHMGRGHDISNASLDTRFWRGADRGSPFRGYWIFLFRSPDSCPLALMTTSYRVEDSASSLLLSARTSKPPEGSLSHHVSSRSVLCQRLPLSHRRASRDHLRPPSLVEDFLSLTSVFFPQQRGPAVSTF